MNSELERNFDRFKRDYPNVFRGQGNDFENAMRLAFRAGWHRSDRAVNERENQREYARA